MKSANLTYQQNQWIVDDYVSIIEDPESHGYKSVDECFDEIIVDIKEDIDSVFNCDIEEERIRKVISDYEDKRQNK